MFPHAHTKNTYFFKNIIREQIRVCFYYYFWSLLNNFSHDAILCGFSTNSNFARACVIEIMFIFHLPFLEWLNLWN